MISALLLAAGQGSRIQYKAKGLLARGGQTFVQYALQELCAAGMEDVVLVTGAEHTAVWAAASDFHGTVRQAYNADYRSGILSSIQCGLRECHPDVKAVLITLVDLPFLTADDYSAVRDVWQKGDPRHLLRAQSGGQPAHPVVIPQLYFEEILQQPPVDKGCSFLFQKYKDRVSCHEIARGRIDIDTMADYHAQGSF